MLHPRVLWEIQILTNQEGRSPLTEPPAADEQLERVIGPWGLAANAVNTAVGGGIFVMPGLVAALLGPGAILAYLLCAAAVVLVLTCFAEIGSLVRRSGGPVAYIEEAFGPLAGFLAWVVYAVGFIAVASAAIANVLVDALAVVMPALSHGVGRILALFLLFASLAAINIVGVRQGMRLSVTTTIAKLVPLLFVIVGGVFVMHWRELHWSAWPTTAALGEGTLLIFFAFQGLEEALSPSGEITDPGRTVPRAIFGAVGALIFLYVALQIVSQGVLGSDLGRQSSAPLAEVAARIAGPRGRALMLIGVVLSIFGSLAAGMIQNPRSFFLMAQNGMLPKALARVHRTYHTPHVAIATVAALTFLIAATGAFKHLAILSSASTLCVYLAICLGALRLRYTRKFAEGAFRAPGGPIVGILGATFVIWILSFTTRLEFAALAGTLALGSVYYFLRRQPWR
jgi:APA family basic amino acid/polyamine antiporter